MVGREFVRIRKWIRDVMEGRFWGDVLEIGPGTVPIGRDVEFERRKYVTMDVGFGADVIGDVVEGIEGEWDTIVMIETLEHVKNPMKALENVRSALRTDGRLIATTPFLILEHGEKGDYWRFTKEFWEVIVRDMGFEIERLDLRYPDRMDLMEKLYGEETALKVEKERMYTGVNVVVRKR